MTFDAVRQNLPTTVDVGASFWLVKHWLLLAQGEFARSGGSGFGAGTEYRIPAGQDAEFAARLGFNSRTVGDVPGFTALSAGLGLALRGAAFDYAVVPMGDLGLTHRVSVTLRWGKGEPAPEPTPVTAIPEPEAPPKVPGDSFEQRDYAAKGRESVHDYAKAAEEWRAADALLEPDDPRHIYTQTRLGESAARQGDAEEAISYYSRAIEFAKTRNMVDKRVVGAYLGLAQRLAAKGSTPSALRNLQKAYDLASDDALRARIKARIEEVQGQAH
jgi:tetratricopeptide (TPR) repeat protein